MTYAKSLDDATFFLLQAEKAMDRARRQASDGHAVEGSLHVIGACRRLRDLILRELSRQTQREAA